MSPWPFKNQAFLDITTPLKLRYGAWIQPDIQSITLRHANGKCTLDILIESPKSNDPDEKRFAIKTIDLSFISVFEQPSASIFDDAKKLVEDFDPYSIINTLPLFTTTAEHAINLIHLSMEQNNAPAQNGL